VGTVCTRFSLHRDQIPYKNFPLPLSDPLPHGKHGDLQEATILLAPSPLVCVCICDPGPLTRPSETPCHSGLRLAILGRQASKGTNERAGV
jgi:hypothetical protein